MDSVRLSALAAKAYERRFECRTQSAENYDGWAYNAKCRELWSMKVKENSEKRGYLCKIFLLVQAAYSVAEITSRWGQLPDPHKNITYFIIWASCEEDIFIYFRKSIWAVPQILAISSIKEELLTCTKYHQHTLRLACTHTLQNRLHHVYVEELTAFKDLILKLS